MKLKLKFARLRLSCLHIFIAKNMSSHHKTSKEKYRSLKCRHFCFPFDTSKEDEFDLLGDEYLKSFTASQADLKGAADNLFASPPRPHPLRFELLSPQLNLSHQHPALQQKIESKLEKFLGS